jgi:carboxylesterase type B
LCHSAYIFASPELLQDMNENWEKVLPITLQYDELYTNLTQNGQLEVSKKVRKFYFQERRINEENRQQLTNVYSDKLFNNGVRKGALLLAKHTHVYMYMFSHNRGDYSIIKSLGVDEVQGVAHLDDISFQFANTYGIAPEFIKGSAAEKVSRSLVKLWASFAKEKTPKAQWGTEQNWPSISKDEIVGKRPLQYYRIDSDTQLVSEPFTDRIKFWEETLEAAETRGYKDEL